MFDAANMQNTSRTGTSESLDGLARAIELVGQEGFLAALAVLCQSASGYDSTFTAAFFPDHPPVELFDNLPDEHSASTIKPYLDFAYFLDPFYNLFLQGVGDRVITLGECAPDDFRASEYYQTFYAGTGLFDETSVFISFGNSAAVVISLGSREEGFQLAADQRAALTALLPCIAALCRRHWPALDPNSLAGSGRMGLHLKKTFDRFASSVLSGREAEIVQLILKGHSSKSIARELGNSPETVKVHRKRIHNKLGITSQGELFSLFLEALTRAPSNATDDPLTYLDRPAGGQL
ncbi:MULTISPECIES: helix-turn-helix transcriptional regulator [Leisingera]|jgi:DNA-binding CsgD family transcriptional regulator|uniref:helix-turn-helix transcriptional regulator n=1 Tax=Leisingera TaxID=191028 RepID=UPI00115443A3|nr:MULTISPECIES: helix-turn-helix transcriptional regulator [Leisingera]QDI77337.1 helix-turn-helix transcriptional regulator [Leisingera aquaemixtae]UWQ24964.1 LuxR C-terminal-related transcriptional regulator [Leisingera aquaemixtae]UWQ45860.1 LuxR C-terminal-related transcriptional regulator [Leisingera aquaemixtae]